MGQILDCSDQCEGEPSDAVIFSFVDGFVWASWPGAVAMVRVGGYEAVTTAMRDFLGQCEVAERLANAAPGSASAQSS